jgi:hypothetical protein
VAPSGRLVRQAPAPEGVRGTPELYVHLRPFKDETEIGEYVMDRQMGPRNATAAGHHRLRPLEWDVGPRRGRNTRVEFSKLGCGAQDRVD